MLCQVNLIMKRILETSVFLAAIYLFCACQKVNSVDDSKTINETAIFTGTDLHGVATPVNIKALVQLASQNLQETAPSVFLIGGDCAARHLDSIMINETYSLSSVIEEIRYGSRGRRNKYFFTYGSHDAECIDAPSAFFSGPAALDNYYLYGISYAQMSFAEDSLAKQYYGLDSQDAFGKSAASASKKFLKWANSLNDNAPIVIMSHMPIHANRGDNFGGQIWCNAINEVSLNHDVFLLFGHNHTIEGYTSNGSQNNPEPPQKPEEPGGSVEPPVGQGEGNDPGEDAGQESAEQPVEPDRLVLAHNEQDFYLVLPGSSIPVQTSAIDVFDTLKINFTYLNAGYINCGYASKITFSDINNDGNYDSVDICRYTVQDTTITYFGNTGIVNPYSSGLKFGTLSR